MKNKIKPVFTPSVYESIRKTVGALPAESGGMLCGNRKTGAITFFFFDEQAECSSVTYVPDTVVLNRMLPKLNAMGLDLMGFAHSHPTNFSTPSGGDAEYCRKIFAANPALSYFVIPIVEPADRNGDFCMRVFIATKNGGQIEIERAHLQVVELNFDDSQIELPLDGPELKIKSEQLAAAQDQTVLPTRSMMPPKPGSGAPSAVDATTETKATN